MNVTLDYTPTCDAIREFHASAERDRCLTGGFGSGKTHAAVAEAIMLGIEYPGNEIDVCRKTFGELDRSTRPTFEELLPKEIIKRPYSSGDHQIHLINGTRIQFFPLDEREKIKSLNAGVILIDEASEVDESTFLMLRARLRRPVSRRCCLVASNPTFKNHWMYKWFGERQFPGRFHRKLSTYDNPYLPKDYVEDLERILPPDLFKVYVLGEWGVVVFGERVYVEFGPSLHLGKVQYNPDYPILRGWDFGYKFPAVMFAQIDNKERIKFLAEIMGKNILIDNFGDDVLRLGERLWGKDVKYEDYGDPAGNHKDPRGVVEETAIQVLRNKFNITVHHRDTPLSHGLGLVRRKFGQNIEGQPAIQIDDTRCPIFVEGLSGGYSCKQNKDGSYLQDEPREDGYFEHVQDAARSILVNKFYYDMRKYETMKRGLSPYKPAFEGCSW